MRKLRVRKLLIEECFQELEFWESTVEAMATLRYRGHSPVTASPHFCPLPLIRCHWTNFLMVIALWPGTWRPIMLCPHSPHCISENGGLWVMLFLFLQGNWARLLLIPKSLPWNNGCSPGAINFLHWRVVSPWSSCCGAVGEWSSFSLWRCWSGPQLRRLRIQYCCSYGLGCSSD